jgi:hypothetical protein
MHSVLALFKGGRVNLNEAWRVFSPKSSLTKHGVRTYTQCHAWELTLSNRAIHNFYVAWRGNLANSIVNSQNLAILAYTKLSGAAHANHHSWHSMKGSKWSARPLGKAHGNLEVMTWLLLQVIRPQLTHNGKEVLNHSEMSWTGSTKLLAKMRKKNYEFRSQFHNFWSSREFTIKFKRIYKLKSGLKEFN